MISITKQETQFTFTKENGNRKTEWVIKTNLPNPTLSEANGEVYISFDTPQGVRMNVTMFEGENYDSALIEGGFAYWFFRGGGTIND